MILRGIRELAGLHIARDIQNTAKPTQLGLSGHQGVGKAKFEAGELITEPRTPTPELA